MPTPMNTLTAVEHLCVQIAIALGNTWTCQLSEDGWYANLIRRSDDLSLFCRIENGKRLCITPDSTEKGIDPNYNKPAITVNVNRDPAKIARDIESRLLTAATTWWADSQAKLAQRKTEETAIAAFERQMQQLTGKTKSQSSNTFYGDGWQCYQYHLATDLQFRGMTHAQTLMLLGAYYEIRENPQ